MHWKLAFTLEENQIHLPVAYANSNMQNNLTQNMQFKKKISRTVYETLKKFLNWKMQIINGILNKLHNLYKI